MNQTASEHLARHQAASRTQAASEPDETAHNERVSALTTYYGADAPAAGEPRETWLANLPAHVVRFLGKRGLI